MIYCRIMHIYIASLILHVKQSPSNGGLSSQQQFVCMSLQHLAMGEVTYYDQDAKQIHIRNVNYTPIARCSFSHVHSTACHGTGRHCSPQHHTISDIITYNDLHHEVTINCLHDKCVNSKRWLPC